MKDVKSIFAWGAQSLNAEDQYQVMQIFSEITILFTQTHYIY